MKNSQRLHGLALTHAELSLGFALACAFEVRRLRQKAKHGEKAALVDSSGLSLNKFDRYLALAERMSVEDPARYIELSKLLPASITEEQLRKKISRIGKALDGRGLTDLYREYGILKTKDQAILPPPAAPTKSEADAQAKAAFVQLMNSFKASASNLAEQTPYFGEEAKAEATAELKRGLENLTGLEVVLRPRKGGA